MRFLSSSILMSKKIVSFFVFLSVILSVSLFYQSGTPAQAACSFSVAGVYGFYNGQSTADVYVGAGRYLIVNGTFSPEINTALITINGATAPAARTSKQINVDLSNVTAGTKTLKIEHPACATSFSRSIDFKNPPPPPSPKYTLTVNKAGTGSGTVTGAGTYNSGTSVTPTATASADSTFAGWSGDCSGTGACTVSMTQNKTVTATFNLAVFPPPTINLYFDGAKTRTITVGNNTTMSWAGNWSNPWTCNIHNWKGSDGDNTKPGPIIFPKVSPGGSYVFDGRDGRKAFHLDAQAGIYEFSLVCNTSTGQTAKTTATLTVLPIPLSVSVDKGSYCIYKDGSNPNDKPYYKVQGTSYLSGSSIAWSSTQNGKPTGENDAVYNTPPLGPQILNAQGSWAGYGLPWRYPSPNDIGSWTKSIKVYKNGALVAKSAPVSFEVKDCTPPPMSGTLTATPASCTIPDNAATCSVDLRWTTVNPQATSLVTSSYPSANTAVASGNNGGPVAVNIPFPSRTFFLYNNGKSLVPTPPSGAGITVNASCGPNSDYIGNVCRSRYAITATQAANGTIVPAGSTVVKYGGSQGYTITPAAGYAVGALIIDGITKPAATSYTFSNVIANHTISATFVPTACANGAINPPACDKCVAGSVMINGKCTPVTVSVTATTPYNTTPGATVAVAYVPTTNSGNTECRLVDYARNPIAPGTYKTSLGSGNTLNYKTLTTSGTYGLYVECRNTAVTSATAYSNPITVNVCPAGSTWNGTVCVPGAKPNLTASAPTPSTATVGAPLVFSSTISNVGTVSTGASFSNFFQRASGPNGTGTITDLAPSTMAALPANGTGVATSPSQAFATAGTYSIRACADKTNRNSLNASTGAVIDESNENDNCSSAWTNVVVSATPQPSGSIAVTSCTIPSGQSSCTVMVTWSTFNRIPNAPTAVTRNNPPNTPFSTAHSESVGKPSSVKYETTTFYLYHNDKELSQVSVRPGIEVKCAPGTTWDGTKCKPDDGGNGGNGGGGGGGGNGGGNNGGGNGGANCPPGKVALSAGVVYVGSRAVTASARVEGDGGGTFTVGSGTFVATPGNFTDIIGNQITGKGTTTGTATVTISGVGWRHSNGATGCSLTGVPLQVRPQQVNES